MRRRTTVRRCAGLVAALALLASGCEFDGAYDLPLPGAPVDADQAYEVTAEFADVLNVVPKSVVMVDDVTVGYVTEVDRIGWHARVTMLVRDGTVLPDNAVAQIKQTSLLGEKYVALAGPTTESPEGRLGDGDRIPLSATGRNPEVEEVLGALSFLLSGGGVGQLATITRELNAVMDGRTDRLRHLLGSLDSVVGTLDDQKADIISAMESMNHLARTLNAEKDTIGDALDVMAPAVRVLSAQHDELVRMLTELDRLGRVGTRVIGQSKDDLVATLTDLQPVLRRLNQVGPRLALGLDMLVSFPFPKEARNVVKGDYANASIRAGINLGVLDPTGGGDGPDLPDLPDVPDIPGVDPGEIISDVQKCLDSGDPASKACQKVLKDAQLYKKLKKACKKKKNKDNEVCQFIAPLPDDDDGDGLPDLPGLPGVGRAGGDGTRTGLDGALSSALTSALPWGSVTPAAVYGGAS